MTDERMTNDEKSPKERMTQKGARAAVAAFGLRDSFGIQHPDFVICWAGSKEVQ